MANKIKKQKAPPAPAPVPEGTPEQRMIAKALYVLDDDLKQIVHEDKELIPQCLLIQACRQSNRTVNALARI